MDWSCLNPRAAIAASIILAAIVGAPASAQAPAPAQVPAAGKALPPQPSPGIHIEYREPTNPQHRALYERLKRRGVLEDYKEFMSPLKLEWPLTISLEECDQNLTSRYMPHTQWGADGQVE